jgi:hypothetical protein
MWTEGGRRDGGMDGGMDGWKDQQETGVAAGHKPPVQTGAAAGHKPPVCGVLQSSPSVQSASMVWTELHVFLARLLREAKLDF